MSFKIIEFGANRASVRLSISD